MAQVKIYGLAEHLNPIKRELSDVLHAAIVETLSLPADKRFQRFFPLAADDFYFPADRTSRYLIIEISMFEGRSQATKKALLTRLMQAVSERFGISPHDIELTIFETPRANWGIRGKPGDELALAYQVTV